MIRLFSSYYRERNSLRRDELMQCLRTNLACTHIGAVHLWLEGAESIAIDDPKLYLRPIDHRPTYRDYVEWAAAVVDSDSDLSVIANSDIYFDKSLKALESALRPSQCAALARWNMRSDGTPELFDRNDSQDAWVFRGLLRPIAGDFSVGAPRCDNRFLHELKRAGYEVINPAFSVRAYHLHAGPRKEYQGENLEHFVAPPYAYLWPHNLWSPPRTLWHNLRHPEARIDWRLDPRKLAASLPIRVSRRLFRRLESAKESVD